MKVFISSVLLALSAGIFASVQGAINSLIGKTTGQYAMIVGVSLFQVIISGAILFFGGGVRGFSAISLPWMIASAALGVIIMFSVSYSIGSIGTLSLFVLLILGQIIASTVIDHFGFFGTPRLPVTLQKIGSVFVIALGVYWFLKSS